MPTEYRPGLEGVTAGISAISEVDPVRNSLIFRGYAVHDLVETCTFEEVAYLVLYGDLPNQTDYDQFIRRIRSQRDVAPGIYDLYRTFDKNAHPMDTLKAAVAVMAAQDPAASDISRESSLRKAEKLLATIPTLVVNGFRVMRGMEPRAPREDLDHNANFLYMLHGSADNALFNKVLNVTQVLYTEHGFNASTFSARVTVSSLADLYCGVVAAIGTLKGALHGGANEEAMQMLLCIGEPSKARDWIQDALASKKKIMGFGHREYKNGDERARIIKRYVELVANEVGETKWLEISNILEEEMLKAKNLHPNIDFPVASLYYMMNIPVAIYTPMFVMSRVIGWSAHIIEQLSNNRIFRPQNEYSGPQGLQVVPMAARK
jgi:citrate synthase